MLVINPDTPRRKWELGRIKATYPGRNGLVRVVDVLFEGKDVRRPVNRISPLDRRLNRTDAEKETTPVDMRINPRSLKEN